VILVTGATGHIGNVLVRKLIQRGEKVRVLVLKNDDMKPLEGLKVEKVEGDVRNLEDVKRAVKGVETVYHLAAVISIGKGKKDLVRKVNVKGVENILKASKLFNVKRILYMSSVHAFAELPHGSFINESVPFDPKFTTGIYGKSKATAALKVLNATKSGLDVVIVCPTGVIGPYDYKGSEMGTMILKFLHEKLPVGIKGSFDFVDVRDVADGAIKACEKGKKGEAYILSGEKIEMDKMMEELRKITGKRGPLLMLGKRSATILSYFSLFKSVLMRKKAIFTPYSVHTLNVNYTFSHEKATKELGYHPRPIVESLQDTIKWFMNLENDAQKLIIL
jgi:dihydroflavonol-4-reductase